MKTRFAVYDLIKISTGYHHLRSVRHFNPFPNDSILESSKLKEFADDDFKFDENGRKFSRWIENTVGKREIARYEQFLLFSQCFQKNCSAVT